MHDTDDFQLRYATGVFNLVCALRAAADISEAESDRRLRGWLANDLRTLLPSPRPASPLREDPHESRNLAGKPSLKIRFPMPIDWIDFTHRVVLLTRCSATDRFSAMPAPATATPGRLQTQENGEATAAPNGTGPSAPTIEEPAAVASGTVCCSSMRAGEYSTPGSGVLSLPQRHRDRRRGS